MSNRMTATPTLERLARPSGGLAMVAMDQRESLRQIMQQTRTDRPVDADLVDVKRAVATALGDLASAFLVDHGLGGLDIAADGLLGSSCGVILAVDDLVQDPAGPVEDTALDPAALAAVGAGVDAVKLLVIWRRDDRREARLELARSFVQAARDRGVLSVLEPVVRPTAEETASGTWELDAAIREAAAEMSGAGPSLTKVQVPLAGAGEEVEQRRASDRLAAVVRGPWVVLSQGVELDRFPAAVEAACRAGASGFLAGRALWSDVVGAPDVPAALRGRSRPRLERLAAIVDAHARPWWQA